MATSTFLELNPVQRYSIREVLVTRHGATDTICITALKEVDGKTIATERFCAGVDEAAALIERSYQREDIKAIWSNLQRLQPGSTKRKNETIDSYTNLLIDIDRKTKKDAQGRKVNATEEERKVLLEAANQVAAFLSPKFGQPVFADSGNGYHLSWHIGDVMDWAKGIPVEEGQKLYKRLLALLKKKFERPDLNVEIDASLSDETQLITVWGTWNRKYPDLPERPQRQSQVLSVPPHVEFFLNGEQKHPQVVTGSMIEQILLTNPIDDSLVEERKPAANGERTQDKQRANQEWLENYGVSHLIEFWSPEIGYESDSYDKNGEEHHPIAPCPCHDDEDFHEHSHERDCEIIVFPDCGIGISCFSRDFGLKQVIKKMNEIRGEKYPHLVFEDTEPTDEQIAKDFFISEADPVEEALDFDQLVDREQAEAVSQEVQKEDEECRERIDDVAVEEAESSSQTTPMTLSHNAAVVNALVDGGLEPDESCGYGRVLEYAKQTNLPLGIALPAVLGVFSIVPDMDEMCGTRINEYVAVIGESGSGKNVAWDRALDVLGLRRDSEFVKNTAPTGARILMQYVGDTPASGRNSKNLPRVPGPRKMLIRSNEISDCFLAGRAESSTLINRLTDFWDENVFELPEPRGGGVCRANCRLSWVGGLPATADKPERFLDIFGRSTGFGLYDRFIFGYLNEPIDFDGKHAWDKSTTQDPVTDLDDYTSRLPGQWTVVTGFEQAAWRLYREWEPPQRLGNRLRHHAKKVAILFASANGETAITAPCMAAAINFMEWQCRLRAIFCGGQAQNQEGEFSEVAREAFEQMTRKGKVPFLPLRIAHDRDWGKRFGDRIVLQGIANLVKLKTIIPSYERGKDGRMYPSEYRYFLNPQLYGAAAGEAVLKNKAEYDEWQETQTQMPETAKEKATRLVGKMAK